VAPSRGIEPSGLAFRFDKVLGILDSLWPRHLGRRTGSSAENPLPLYMATRSKTSPIRATMSGQW
jgi:hypothetical protein